MRRLLAAGTLLVAFTASFALARSALGPPATPGPVPRDVEPDGIARLDVMLDGADLFVDLDASPAALLGLVRPPSNASERATMERAHALLLSGDALRPAPAARCRLDTTFALMGRGHDELCSSAPTATDPSTRGNAIDDPDGPLGDIAGRWSWVCDAPERLDRIDTALFGGFARLVRIDVDVDGPGGARRATLSPGNSVIGMAHAR